MTSTVNGLLLAIAALSAAGDGQARGARARGDIGRFFGECYYPREAAARGEQGAVVAAIDVDATGKPVTCRIVRTSGSPRLDSGTCAIILDHVRYWPARDAEGRAVPSVVPFRAVWHL